MIFSIFSNKAKVENYYFAAMVRNKKGARHIFILIFIKKYIKIRFFYLSLCPNQSS